MADPRSQPPEAFEFEISVFGPGVGESIVVHIGAGHWVIVDSCRDPQTRRPAALVYLSELGIDVASAVKVIAATHWHDDHIGGIAETLAACPHAIFASSAALNREEFYVAVELSRAARVGASTSGLTEFSSVFELLRGRAPDGARRASIGPRWVIEDTRLHHREAAALPAAEVRALSPAPATMTMALHDISRYLAGPGAPQRAAVSLEPNALSIVLWVTFGDKAALLGADLEHTPNPLTGWNAVVDARPSQKAIVFKVPHHGSSGADKPEVWPSMLTKAPRAIVTPFTRSGLPRDSDLKRLSARTEHLSCTGRSRGTRPARRGGAVDRTADQVARNRRTLVGPLGHVRVRMPAEGGEPRVDLFTGAFQYPATV